MRTVLGILFLALGLTACSNLSYVDQSRLNHPAMDLTQDKTPAQSAYLTNLDITQSPSSGGSCAVCAH